MFKKFPCTQCGCCCKRVDKLINKGIEFPYKAKKNGSCEMLTKRNKCKVYDSRPILCNIDKLGEIFGIEKQEFYQINIEACNKMMDEDNIPLKYRIKTL